MELGPDTPDEHFFTHGFCHALAVVMHLRYHLQIVGVGTYHEDRQEWVDVEHLLVRDREAYFDIRGHIGDAQAVADAQRTGSEIRLAVRDLSLAEVNQLHESMDYLFLSVGDLERAWKASTTLYETISQWRIQQVSAQTWPRSSAASKLPVSTKNTGV